MTAMSRSSRHVFRASIAAAVPILLFACATQQPELHAVAIGDRVTLRAAESVVVEPRGVVLQFAEVVSDSRCPSDVTCVWEGDAEVSVRAVADDGASGDLRLHTKMEPRSAEFAGLVVRLVELRPFPKQGAPTRQADYEVTIEIRGKP